MLLGIHFLLSEIQMCNLLPFCFIKYFLKIFNHLPINLTMHLMKQNITASLWFQEVSEFEKVVSFFFGWKVLQSLSQYGWKQTSRHQVGLCDPCNSYHSEMIEVICEGGPFKPMICVSTYISFSPWQRRKGEGKSYQHAYNSWYYHIVTVLQVCMGLFHHKDSISAW